MNNSPEKLPEASAVQWNDYVLVLPKERTALLYHTKQRIWSLLPKCSINPLNGPPLTTYRGEIITICPNGVVASFHVSSSEWRSMDDLKITLETVNATILSAVLTSHDDALYAVVQWKNITCRWEDTIHRTKSVHTLLIELIYVVIVHSLGGAHLEAFRAFLPYLQTSSTPTFTLALVAQCTVWSWSNRRHRQEPP